jgi:hypothetical protein
VSTAVDIEAPAGGQDHREIAALQQSVRMLRAENAYLHERIDYLLRQTALEIGVIDLHHAPPPRNTDQQQRIETPIRAAQSRFANNDRVAAVKHHRTPRKVMT